MLIGRISLADLALNWGSMKFKWTQLFFIFLLGVALSLLGSCTMALPRCFFKTSHIVPSMIAATSQHVRGYRMLVRWN